jgi:hypothetical protein
MQRSCIAHRVHGRNGPVLLTEFISQVMGQIAIYPNPRRLMHVGSLKFKTIVGTSAKSVEPNQLHANDETEEGLKKCHMSLY